MRVETKQKQIKEVEVIIESLELCDKCNSTIKGDQYNAFKCNLTHTTGDIFPDGGSGEKQIMDICQDCAGELIILLRNSGYRVCDSDWEL